jgi:hypothetical protein
MAVVYSDTLKTNRLQIMSDRVAGKTAAAATGSATAGQLVIGTAALSGATGVLATIALPTAPFVVSGSGTVIATLQGVPLSVNASATGTAAKAELRQNNGTTVEASGLTVGTSGSDINLTSVSITSGQTVTVTSGTITHG